jgi:hypothetical protein
VRLPPLLLQKQSNDDYDSDNTKMEEMEPSLSSTSTSQPTPSHSLEHILNKARKRPMIMFLPYQIQAYTNKPILQTSPSSPVPIPFVITIGDALLVTFAILLNSIGFAIGYTIGKLSIQSIRQRSDLFPIVLTELWTVSLAIMCDLIWRNI